MVVRTKCLRFQEVRIELKFHRVKDWSHDLIYYPSDFICVAFAFALHEINHVMLSVPRRWRSAGECIYRRAYSNVAATERCDSLNAVINHVDTTSQSPEQSSTGRAGM